MSLAPTQQPQLISSSQRGKIYGLPTPGRTRNALNTRMQLGKMGPPSLLLYLRLLELLGRDPLSFSRTCSATARPSHLKARSQAGDATITPCTTRNWIFGTLPPCAPSNTLFPHASKEAMLGSSSRASHGLPRWHVLEDQSCFTDIIKVVLSHLTTPF